MVDLGRFHLAQNSVHGGYAGALRELRAGRKRGHWIWYIFPQVEGLGRSSTSVRYAIHSLEEASVYLRDPVLGPRLVESSNAVAAHLRQGRKLVDLMGSQIDALKLVSSLTLFLQVAQKDETACPEMASLAREVLEMAAGQGYGTCRHTILTVERWTSPS